ncbi:glutaminase [Roseibacillus ishigakijimensis]|uniref:Glutaminase n=1 Tax=Roseibacillus ishigakijimensis TaxID=454146 RepID=A0A934RU63_9BACT|nr:glutaminase [Roseibacillus ishigakijimensis]MBK1834561.1 glutaminase [Roseibacillus ishigakijimensis]
MSSPPSIDYQPLLDSIVRETAGLEHGGRVADYIPELAKVAPDHFGMALHTLDGGECQSGEGDEPFSIQSISKVFLLMRAIQPLGRRLRERVGVEPSGDPFNSLVQLEYEKGYPRNPFINAGAIVVCDVLLDLLAQPADDFLAFVREISGNPALHYDEEVAWSEQRTGHHNRAIAHLIKGYGHLRHEVEDVLAFYFQACSLAMSCRDLARACGVLANGGQSLVDGTPILTPRRAKRINATMMTCGLYDEAGEFAFRVGLPAKSGVGGGIVAVHPGHFSVAVWSPPLNTRGNSHRGFRALELLSDATGSIF